MASKTWLQTFTGRKFDLLNPHPSMVCIEDMAHALARINRFVGHLDLEHYSVAEHSWRMAQLYKRDPLKAYEALMHDGHEAYIGDWPTPVKEAFKAFDIDLGIVERPIIHVVRTWAGVPVELDADVKVSDWRMCVTEAFQNHAAPPEVWYDVKDVLPNVQCAGLRPLDAERLFLYEYRYLRKELGLDARG